MLFAIVMASLLTGERAEAQTLLYWNTNGGGGWGTANWNTSASGSGGNTTWTSGDVAVFNSSKSGVSNVATTVELSTAQIAAGLIFSNNTLATALISSNTTTNTLNLGQYGIVVATGNGPVTIGNTSSNITIILSANQGWTNNSTSLLSILGNVSGAYNLTIASTGNGTTVLTGSNSYTGGTILSGGTVAANSGSAFGTGTVTFASNSTVLNGTTATETLNNNFVIASGVVGGINAGTGTSPTKEIVIGGIISGAGTLSLTSGTNAEVTLNPGGNNTYSGGTLLNGGQVQFGVNGYNDFGTGTITFASNNTLMRTLITGTSITNATVIAAGAGVTLTNPSTYTLTYSGNISGAGSLTISSQDSATTVNLSGSNSFAGPTTIAVGILHASSTNALSSNSVLTISNTGTLSITNFNNTVGGLNGVGSVTLGSATLAIARVSNSSSSYGGIISGTGGLAISGTGTATLTGTNIYSGGTTLNAGTLAISNNAALGTGTLTYAGNSTLAALTNLTITNAAVISTGVTATNNNGGFTLTNTGVISGAGALTFTGSGTNALTANNTFTGALTLNSGTTILTGNNTNRPGGTANNTVVGTGATLQLQANSSNTVGLNSFALSGAVSTNALLLQNGSTISLLSDSSINFVGGNGLGLGTAGTTVTFNVGSLTSAGSNNTISIASTGFLVANTTINVTGSGIGDTLSIGNLTAVSSSYGLTLNANGANLQLVGVTGETYLQVNGSNNTTITGTVSGTGAVTLNGTGTLSLNASNNYSGGTTLNAGTLAVNNNASMSTGTVTFASNSTLLALANLTITNSEVINSGVTATNNNGGFALTQSGIISGAGGLTSTGTGTLTLTSTNTYTGTTTIATNGGALSLGTTGKLASTNIVVNSGGTLLLGGNGQTTTNTALTLNGGTISTGGGISTRAGTNSFSTLTLTANSTIDFSQLPGNTSLIFGNITSSSLDTYTLTITNWSGTEAWGQIIGGGTQTALIDLVGSGSFNATELSHISFYGTNGSFLGTATFDGSGVQLIPVPEPTVIIAGGLLLGWMMTSLVAKIRRAKKQGHYLVLGWQTSRRSSLLPWRCRLGKPRYGRK